MKSRISFCKGAVLRRDLSRFAPAWILYTLCLLLGLVMLSGNGTEYWLSHNIATGIGPMGMVNFAYALLTALLLFGDLTNTRMCNGLHALPLRRESWFFTHVLSGLLFSILPTAIMTVPAVVLSTFSAMEQGWQIPLYWLLGTNLEYLFFFGLAVFCMMLSGSRMGAAVIYGIVNFASILAFYMADVVYVPHLPGVVAQIEPFLTFCPVAMMASVTFVQTRQVHDFHGYNSDGSENFLLRGTFTLAEEWWYLVVCAVIGAVLILLALFVYKKRKLECAGDLMATRRLEPVFLTLFALVAGSLCQLLYVAFLGYDSYGSATFLWGGLIVGWFAGLMLLRRSSRVFSLKSFLGLAVLAAALGVSLLLNSMDVFSITTWVPKAEDVKAVNLRLSYMFSVTLEEEEDIGDLLRLHELAADARLGGELGAVNTAAELEDGDGTLIGIEYEMKDGSTAAREYFILIDSEAGDIARKFFSRTGPVFTQGYYSNWEIKDSFTDEDLMALLDTPEEISISGVEVPQEQLTRENARKLLEAIIADSEAGNLVQHSAFHPVPVYEDEALEVYYFCYSVNIEFPGGTVGLDIFSDSEHTLAWLEENGMMPLLHAKILESNGIG